MNMLPTTTELLKWTWIIETMQSFFSHEASNGNQRENKKYYSTHNSTIRVSISVSAWWQWQQCGQNFRGVLWELCCPRQSKQVLTKVSFNTKIYRFGSLHNIDDDGVDRIFCRPFQIVKYLHYAPKHSLTRSVIFSKIFCTACILATGVTLNYSCLLNLLLLSWLIGLYWPFPVFEITFLK